MYRSPSSPTPPSRAIFGKYNDAADNAQNKLKDATDELGNMISLIRTDNSLELGDRSKRIAAISKIRTDLIYLSSQIGLVMDHRLLSIEDELEVPPQDKLDITGSPFKKADNFESFVPKK